MTDLFLTRLPRRQPIRSVHTRQSDTRQPEAYSVVAPVPGAHAPLYARLAKRWLDLCLTLIALPLVVPLIALLWLCVRLDGGPGFYRQSRIGRNGRQFYCWKLRSMRPDADAALARLLARDPIRAREWAVDQKLRDDPRITRLGRWLRISSLDELPQLWCVLKGEMSLVGPRPFTPAQLNDYLTASGPDRARAYLAQRPGLTGLWQVEGRGGTDFAARAAFDQRYARGMSLRGDLGLLLRTVGVVCRGTGQ